MRRGTGLVMALAMGLLTACAAAGGPAAVGNGEAVGERPRDDDHTRTAGVQLAQASLLQGDEARTRYQAALDAALMSIERDPTNPRAYMLAGQAAVGTEGWVAADTLLARAEELNPGYANQIESEREEAWVNAYNMGAEALAEEDLDRALELFRGADIMFQARPEARIGLAMVQLRRGDTEAAIEAYGRALEILAQPPPEGFAEEQIAAWDETRRVATFNRAQLLAQTGQFDEAADLLSQFLREAEGTLDPEMELQTVTTLAGFLAQAGRQEEADALYRTLLDREDLGSGEFFQIGIGYFNTGDYRQAADAFATAARLNRHSRDSYLNLVQALYSAALDVEDQPESPQRNEELREMYTELLAAADRVAELDPLNRNLMAFTLRAYRALADISPDAEAQRLAARSQEVFRAYEQQQYEVTDISLSARPNNRVEIGGVLVNLGGTPGSQVALRFTLTDASGNTIDTSTAQIALPATGEAVEFATVANMGRGELAGWSYELVN